MVYIYFATLLPCFRKHEIRYTEEFDRHLGIIQQHVQSQIAKLQNVAAHTYTLCHGTAVNTKPQLTVMCVGEVLAPNLIHYNIFFRYNEQKIVYSPIWKIQLFITTILSARKLQSHWYNH